MRRLYPGLRLSNAVSVDIIKSWVVASIAGFFFCMWYAAKKHRLANNVLRISSHIQGIKMLSMGTILLDDTNQLMGKVWDWNIYGTKLKKIGGWVLQTANEDGKMGEDDATALLEDSGDGPEDRGDGDSDSRDGPEDGSNGHEDGNSGHEDHGDSGTASEDSNDELPGQRAVQLLAICANFPISKIIGHDWHLGQYIYVYEGGVQEEGMVDLVPIGPCEVLMAYGYFILHVYYSTTTASDEGSSMIEQAWDVSVDREIEEYTRTIYAGPRRKLEITYLVIPNAIEANVEFNLKFKDLGSRSCAIYGKIKANSTAYRNKSVHLFSYERGTSLSFPSDSTSILPLSPPCVAVPCCRNLELNIEVDLTIITTCDDSQEEQSKNLKFSLEFSHGVRSQEREVDGDQVEVNIAWYPIE